MDEQASQAANPPAGDEALRELAVRLLASRFMGPGLEAGAVEPRLLVGQMPADLPFELPVPEGARVLGTLVHGIPTVALDTALAGDDAVAFYRDQLRARGWSEEPFGPHHGGFVNSAFGDRAMGNFFSPDGQYRLLVNTAPAPGGRTTLQLSVHSDGREQAQQMRQRRGMGRDVMAIFPVIRSPSGGRQFSEGGSSGGDRADTFGRLEGDFDVPSLVTHYTEELVRGGWERSDGGHSGPVAWSTWTFRDDEGAAWRGLLLILRRTDLPGRFDLLVKAETGDGDGRAPGGFSTSTIHGGPARLIGTQAHSYAPLTWTSGQGVTPTKPERPGEKP